MKKTKQKPQAPVGTEKQPVEKEGRGFHLRKSVSQIFVVNVKDLESNEVLFSRAEVVDVSPTGILLSVLRGDILSIPLRSSLSMTAIEGKGIGFTIEVMDTYIEGVIARTKPQGGGDFVIAIDFREDAPEYWRQCLVDLLPSEEEGDGHSE